MQLLNTKDGYGWANIVLHWLMALLLFGQFGVGLYMTGLTYYDPLYTALPWWHKSFGLVFAFLLIIRLFLRAKTTSPEHNPLHKVWEITVATLTHRLLYVVMFIIVISGYLISTADGRGIEVFGWFTIPATLSDIENQEDIAGIVHLYASWFIITLVALHAAGAIKHQWVDRDSTLIRMFKPASSQTPTTKEVEHEH